jgi:hypothetical protein
MKRQILITTITVAGISAQAQPARAKCASWSLRTTPAKGATGVPTNAQLFFAIYGWDRQKAAMMLKGAALVSQRGHRVPLRVTRLPSSRHSYQMQYVTLVPTQRLRPRTRYGLALAPHPAQVDVTRIAQRFDGYQITTGAGPDRQAPARPGRMTTTGYVYRRLGCGPAVYIPLNLHGLRDGQTPADALRFRVNVKERSRGATRRLTLYAPQPWRPKELQLGHGMCSGLFVPRRGAQYTVTVQAIDWAGNVSLPSPALTAHAR